MEVMCFINNSG